MIFSAAGAVRLNGFLRCAIAGFVLLIVCNTRVFASQLDSLVQLANSMKDDTNKVKLLSDLCFYHRSVSSDTALHYGKRALMLAEKLSWPKGIAQAYNDIAIVHIDKNEYDDAIFLLNESLKLRIGLKDELGQAAVYNKLGIVYQEKFQLQQALDYNYKALDIYERHGQKFYLTYVLNNIGVLHFNLREYDKAVDVHNRALQMRKEIGDTYGVAASYGNLANVYYENKDTLKAIENWEFAISNFRSMNKPEELAVQLNNLGGLLVVRKQYRKALPMLEEAYEIRKNLNDKKAIASVLISLGEAQMMSGDFANSKRSLHESLSLSSQIDTRHEMLFAYMKLAKLSAFLNQPDSAYYYMEQYSLLKDAVFNDDLKEQVAEVRTKYETEKKEKLLLQEQARSEHLALEKAQAELRAGQRMKWIWILGSGSIALLFLALFIIQRNRRKLQAEKDAEIIREREKGIEAVILATEEERKRIARELHDGIGQQLGGLKLAFQQLAGRVKEKIPDEGIKMEELTKIIDDSAVEVRGISHQMMPKVLQEIGLVPAIEDMLRKSLGQTSIQYEFESYGIENRFSEKVEVSLYRICQELVNNILKHSGANRVTVQLFQNKGFLIMIVEDNGKGFSDKDKKEGIGMMNISTRINTIHGEVNFEPSPGAGTVATIRVPVI